MRTLSGLMNNHAVAAITAALLMVLALPCQTLLGQDSAERLAQLRRAAFTVLDQDADRQLSEEEYLKRGGDARVLRRDFKLFDFNGDKKLSQSEFDMTPSSGKPRQRGPMPDPYDGLLEQAIEALDEAYDGWNNRTTEQMNSTFFAINFAASLSTDNRRRLEREIVAQADPNGDHSVTREEAKRFLEIQLGIRWTTGNKLRLENGRVVNFARFLRSDANSDDVISKQEFIETWWRPQTAEADFEAADRDNDGRITLREFTRVDGPNIVDPIEDFRKADTNFDALLDKHELRDSTPGFRQSLISSSLSGFDENGDGKLSLSEFRLSMLGNHNYSWGSIPKDDNDDSFLSFEEFVFSNKRSLFQLHRRFYFHRHDLDRDNKLSADEFEFKSKAIHSLVMISLEDGVSREVYRRREFPTCGSPAVSNDGKWIAFDVTPSQGISKARILKMTPDGKNVHNLTDGLMPSWSIDGERFACSRYEGGSGIWIMKADGTPEKRIADGWAAQWSPDGKSIAYTNDNSLRVYDVDSEETRVVLAKGEHPYQYIFWNMAWSPDSKRMVFKGRLPNKQQLAIVNMTGAPDLKTYHATDRQIGADLAWSPDGKRIVFNLNTPEKKKALLYEFSPEGDGTPIRMKEVGEERAVTSVCFSPDGKWLIYATPN